MYCGLIMHVSESILLCIADVVLQGIVPLQKLWQVACSLLFLYALEVCFSDMCIVDVDVEGMPVSPVQD